MEEKDIDLLFLQIKNIIFNKPISKDLKVNAKELENLQVEVYDLRKYGRVYLMFLNRKE